MTVSNAAPAAGRLAAGALLAIFLVVAALTFFGLYALITTPHQFWALVAIGFFSLLFAVAAYFGQAFAQNAGAARGLAYGFAAFGFGVLFLTVLAFPFLYPASDLLSLPAQVGLLILLLVLLVVPIVGAMTGANYRRSEAFRATARAQWRQSSPPSAFSYAAAQTPSTPPPAAPAGRSPPSGGA